MCINDSGIIKSYSGIQLIMNLNELPEMNDKRKKMVLVRYCDCNTS